MSSKNYLCCKSQIIIMIDLNSILLIDILSKLSLCGNYKNAKNQIIFPQQELIKLSPYKWKN